MYKPRVLFYCQHVLGIGHLIRSAEVVRGLHSFDVTFLNGGQIANGFELPASVEVVNLPPIESDAEFKEIQAANAADSLETVKDQRLQLILDTYARVRPDVIVIELFPFGRKKFAFELLPLLERARLRGAKVVCSLRDILVHKPGQEAWEERVCRIVNQYFDLIAIHSDPRFQGLEETFGRTEDIRCALEYTGFVVPSQPSASSERLVLPDEAKPLVVASIGGGRVGSELLAAAIEASGLIESCCPHHLRVIGGPYISDSDWRRIQNLASAKSSVSLLRQTTRFADYLQRASLSISMSGYNTCMNVLAADVPALVLPFTGNGNNEQTIRARKLEQVGVLGVLEPEDLAPEALGQRMIAKLASGRRRGRTAWLDTSGVRTTARLLENLVAQKAVLA